MLFVKQLALIALVATAGNVSAGRRNGYSTLVSSRALHQNQHYVTRPSTGGYLATSASSGYPVQQKIEETEAIEQQPIQQQPEQQQQQLDNHAEEELNNVEDSVAQQGNYASYRAGYSTSFGHRSGSGQRARSRQQTTTPAPRDFGENLPEELPAQELLAPPPLPPRKPKPQLQLFPTEQQPEQNSEPPASSEEQAKFVDFQHIKYGEIPPTPSTQDFAPRMPNFSSQKPRSFQSTFSNSNNNNNNNYAAGKYASQQQSGWQPQTQIGYDNNNNNQHQDSGIPKMRNLGLGMSYNAYSASSGFDEGGYGGSYGSSAKQNYNGERIKAAIRTHQTIEYRDVPIEQEELKPIMIEIPASENTLSLHFKSRSSQLNIRQNHESGKGSVQETSSEDEPQILRHIVTKPIYQEIREIIKPMRKITQEIRPVKEEIRTIVSKADKSKSKAKNNQEEQGYSSQNSDAGQDYNQDQQQQLQQEEQIKEQTNYDNSVLQEVNTLSGSTEASVSGSTDSSQDLSGFDDTGFTEASVSTQKPISSYSSSRSYSSSGYNSNKPSPAPVYGARKPSSYAPHKPISSSYAPQNQASAYNVKGQGVEGQSAKPVGGSVPFTRMSFTMGPSAKKQNNFASSFGTNGVLPPKPSRSPFRQNHILGRSAALFEHEDNNQDEPDIAVTPAPRQRFVPSAAPGSSDHEIIEDELENAELHVPLPESLQGAASARSYRKALKAMYKQRKSRNIPKQRLYRTSIN